MLFWESPRLAMEWSREASACRNSSEPYTGYQDLSGCRTSDQRGATLMKNSTFDSPIRYSGRDDETSWWMVRTGCQTQGPSLPQFCKMDCARFMVERGEIIPSIHPPCVVVGRWCPLLLRDRQRRREQIRKRNNSGVRCVVARIVASRLKQNYYM
jgi:hypothetical protein